MDPALLYALFGAGYSATEDAHVEAEERRREEGMREQKKQNIVCCWFWWLVGVVGFLLELVRKGKVFCQWTTRGGDVLGNDKVRCCG